MDWTDVPLSSDASAVCCGMGSATAGRLYDHSGRAKGLAAGISLAAFGLHTLLFAVTGGRRVEIWASAVCILLAPCHGHSWA